MVEVKTSYMSSERQSGNQGDFGYVPTARYIVEKELDLIDFSAIKNNDFVVNIADLSGGIGEQLDWSCSYLGKNNIKTDAYYNEITLKRYKECADKFHYMKKLNTDFFRLKICRKEGRSDSKKVFSIIRNNPPYMYLQRRGKNVRAEQEFFLKNSTFSINGGIQIMEIPLHQLAGIKNFISMITYRYKDIFIAKFPRGEFEKFKQVVIIGKLKSEFNSDKGAELNLIKQITEDTIPYLDDIDAKVISVSKEDFQKAKEINIFRENLITNETLKNGLNEVLESLLTSEKKATTVIVGKEPLKPIIELQPGHVSQLLASGKYDGIMGDLLIRGGANKEIVTQLIKEDEKETTIETETIKPFIEITNKIGEIVYKDF